MWHEITFHRNGARGCLLVACCFFLSAVTAGAATPGIELTSVPAYGSFDSLSGRVSDANPSDYAVAVYIHVPPYGWWTKPFAAYPVTSIQSDGTWTCFVVTGGEDAYATEVIAFLIPKTYSPPVVSGDQCLPAALYAYPYAKTVRYQAIQFANCDWLVKRAYDPVDPGPNYFSDSTGNVWIDSGGSLHLKVMQQSNRWYCGEVIADRNLGYGRYALTVTSGIAGLNPNVVLGFFTWEDCVPEYHAREMDVEVSRWGDAGSPNAQFVVQPADTPGNRHRFEVDPASAPGGVTTHEFTWEAGRIDFRSYRGAFVLNPSASDIIESWSYASGAVPPPGKENLRMNLWLTNGLPPTDAHSAEVVVGRVTYLPYEPNNVYRFWSPKTSHHFYTISESEKAKLQRDYPTFWTYEGVACSTLATGGRANLSPIYRFWSNTLSAHFYTVNAAERDKLINNYSHVWTYEGTAFYAYADGQQPPGTAPVYRFWSSPLSCHFYTTSEDEKNKLINVYSYVWTYEGIAWHAYSLPIGQ
jgi:hypothetical protein